MLTEIPAERVIAALRFITREERVSQESLAKRVAMSSSALARRLSGQVPISLEELRRIATALNYNVCVSFERGSAA